MRRVVSVELHLHPKYPMPLWLVEFDDGSRVAVDVTRAVFSHEKTEERIKSAALKYSEANPDGVLSSIVVDLLGQKIN